MNASKCLMAAVVALSVAGCGGSNTVPTGAGTFVPDSDFGGGDDSGVAVAGVGDRSLSEFERDVVQSMSPADQELLLNNLTVYFEFDSSDIRPDFNPMLAAHGRFLNANPQWRVRLEGHADERGSREYNIGLGERRAQAVRQILQLQGAPNAALTTISYGEERPQAFGSDEASYRENRRVELVYQ